MERIEESFTEAYLAYKEPLFAHALFRISDRALAQDLVQTAFLKTWEYLLRFGEITSTKAFLYHALDHLIIDEYRKQKTVSLDALTERGLDLAVNESGRLFDAIDGKSAMTSIPLLADKYCRVVSMRYQKNMRLKEIADSTHQTENTVAVQIHRGVRQLAGLFLAIPLTRA